MDVRHFLFRRCRLGCVEGLILCRNNSASAGKWHVGFIARASHWQSACSSEAHTIHICALTSRSTSFVEFFIRNPTEILCTRTQLIGIGMCGASCVCEIVFGWNEHDFRRQRWKIPTMCNQLQLWDYHRIFGWAGHRSIHVPIRILSLLRSDEAMRNG